jgi:hypothetical protein
MKAKNLCITAGLCAGVASVAVAGDKPDLQKLDNAIEVTPQRIAKVRYENGQARMVSDWTDYNGSSSRSIEARVFDCFGDDDSDRFMDDVGGCFTTSTSRWYFGTGYCNMFTVADHTVEDGTVIADGFCAIDFAWQWTCAGFGTETCIVAVFTQESVPCDPSTFDYSGWLLDFGTLSCNPGGYYYTNVDLSTGSWPIPATGTGSHMLIYAQSVTTSGALVLATCAQTMLWGNTYGGANERGSQVTEQYDDDNPADGTHTTSECYTYDYGLCPDPLGAMVQWWGSLDDGGECDYADFNGDGTVNTQDFSAFFNQWVPKDASADCNGDGTVNTQDVTCFLNLWNSCRP